jgi:hypothetical protein
MKRCKPTTESYGSLQAAYDYFNRILFNGTLQDCMIQFGENRPNTIGYFHAQQWELDGKGEKRHTIALTPMYLRRGLRETLSTLVHEMAHLWQEDHGKASRNGYHNKEWGQKMKGLGLHPSNTGKPGGKETGQQMTHYIVDGGPFDLAFKKLPKGISLAWLGSRGIPILLGADDADSKEKKKKNKVKYECPDCEPCCWGKPELSIICGDCETQLESPE